MNSVGSFDVCGYISAVLLSRYYRTMRVMWTQFCTVIAIANLRHILFTIRIKVRVWNSPFDWNSAENWSNQYRCGSGVIKSALPRFYWPPCTLNRRQRNQYFGMIFCVDINQTATVFRKSSQPKSHKATQTTLSALQVAETMCSHRRAINLLQPTSEELNSFFESRSFLCL